MSQLTSHDGHHRSCGGAVSLPVDCRRASGWGKLASCAASGIIYRLAVRYSLALSAAALPVRRCRCRLLGRRSAIGLNTPTQLWLQLHSSSTATDVRWQWRHHCPAASATVDYSMMYFIGEYYLPESMRKSHHANKKRVTFDLRPPHEDTARVQPVLPERDPFEVDIRNLDLHVNALLYMPPRKTGKGADDVILLSLFFDEFQCFQHIYNLDAVWDVMTIDYDSFVPFADAATKRFSLTSIFNRSQFDVTLCCCVR